MRRWQHPLAVAAAAIPAALLLWDAVRGGLGANPIETITHTTGEWALRLLLLSLAVTPLRRLSGVHSIARLRRTLGLCAFAYAAAHFVTWLALDRVFEWGAIVEDIFERPYIAAGFTAFVLLLPLVVTSTRAMVRRLGRRWVQLHRLAYVSAGLAVLHYLWLVKADLVPPLAHAAVLMLLLGLRLPGLPLRRGRRRVRGDTAAAGGDAC